MPDNAACIADTPRCNALESNPLDSFDYRAWVTLAKSLERELEEKRYQDIEHDHLGCSVAKTGIYAPRSESVHGWGPVADGELPRGIEDVLVWTITGHCLAAHPSQIRALHAEAKNSGEDCFYTHWMPMPKGPSNARR